MTDSDTELSQETEESRKIVAEIRAKINDLLTREEEIVQVAVQKKLGKPEAVVATNKRFIVYTVRSFGRAAFDDYLWRDLSDVRLKEHMRTSELSFQIMDGKDLKIDKIPKDEARRLYSFAQEMEEYVAEERRLRTMEEERAKAGGVVMSQPAPMAAPPAPAPTATQDDPMTKIGKLKEMLEAEIITEDDFNAKKQKIIDEM